MTIELNKIQKDILSNVGTPEINFYLNKLHLITYIEKSLAVKKVRTPIMFANDYLDVPPVISVMKYSGIILNGDNARILSRFITLYLEINGYEVYKNVATNCREIKSAPLYRKVQ